MLQMIGNKHSSGARSTLDKLKCKRFNYRNYCNIVCKTNCRYRTDLVVY